AGCSSDGIPAVRRIVWISSASVRSLATATCTMPTEACLLVSERAALDEYRRAPLSKRDVDDIEVPGHDRRGKHGPRLARDLGPEVPVREVREGEELHRGDPRELGRVAGRRVPGLVRTLAL